MTNLVALRSEIEEALREHVLQCWFPRCIDELEGGYHQNYANDWAPQEDGTRDLVFQARMLWVCATAARLREDLRDEFTVYADHGMQGLQVFEDNEYGGLQVQLNSNTHKHSYAIAFALFAYSAYFRLRGDVGTYGKLNSLFDWWQRLGRDREHGGFFDVLTREGTPVLDDAGFAPLIPTAPGLRSANTLIHIVEALTEQYAAAPNEVVKQMLLEVLSGLETSIARNECQMLTSYTREWAPVDRRISFGHDIEAVTLVLDARRALGIRENSSTQQLARRVMSRSIDWKLGGMYFQTNRRFGRDKRKMGWVQAEALLGLLTLHQRTGGERSRYLDAFVNVWAFVSNNLIDEARKGIFAVADREGNVLDNRKGHRWKACYHYARALLRVSDMLEVIVRDARRSRSW